jgi:hypothetical protein
MNLFTTAVWHSIVDPQYFFPKSNVCINGLTCSTLSLGNHGSKWMLLLVALN